MFILNQKHFYYRRLALAMVLLNSPMASAYDYSDNQPYSQAPPQGLSPNEVPMFVSIGFDDNSLSGIVGSGGTGAMTWISDYLRNKNNSAGFGNPLVYDSTPIRVSFFNNSKFQEETVSDDPVFVKRAWNVAYNDGHEIGTHTVNHLHGSEFNLAEWNSEVGNAILHLSKPFNPNEQPGNSSLTSGMGADPQKLIGFRTPFLEYTDETFLALVQQGLTYDASIEEGWENTMDGTNYPWPYTLDSGSPGNEYLLASGFPLKFPISSHPGLWELGVNPFIIPPDNLTSQYGINYSIRDKVFSNLPFFDPIDGKVTGFDYNLWAQAKLNKAETLATLKYTLDLRLQNGNRAPLMIGAHTDYYGSKNENLFSQITVRERQQVIEEFLTYAQSKPEVRVVPYKDIVNWMRNPSPLDCTPNCPTETLPPIITSIDDQSNEVDAIISLPVQAIDPNQYDLTFSADNLPSGLSIDTASGLISGVVTTESNNAVTIYADNDELISSITFNWQVSNATSNPWEVLNAIEDRLTILKQHNNSLSNQYFKGRNWYFKWRNKVYISNQLHRAAKYCRQGNPYYATLRLQNLLYNINRKMKRNNERQILQQQLQQEIINLEALQNEQF